MKQLLALILAFMASLSSYAQEGGLSGGGGDIANPGRLTPFQIGGLIEREGGRQVMEALKILRVMNLNMNPESSLAKFQMSLNGEALDKNLQKYLGSIDFREDRPCDAGGKHKDGSFNPTAPLKPICISVSDPFPRFENS
jgi:hypothetical protein